MSKAEIRLHVREDRPDWEQIAFAEVLIPETRNVFGDWWTPAAVRECAYRFMRDGFGVDIDHDNNDVSGEKKVYVVETFIARPGDPDFIEGSWVVGIKVEDPEIWQKILDNELNGFSYEAMLSMIPGILYIEDDGIRMGYTEEDVNDGHKHSFVVLVDEDNRPISGGTDEVNGHSHTIATHTVTEEADGHSHRYNIVLRKDRP